MAHFLSHRDCPRCHVLLLGSAVAELWGGSFENLAIRLKGRDFPGSPVVRTLCSQCRGHGFDPFWGNKMLHATAAAAAKLLQSCPTLCDPIDGSSPGSPVPGILQARTLAWVAISFSNAWKWKVKGKSLSHVRLFATPWTAAYQAPPSMGFSRQEHSPPKLN